MPDSAASASSRLLPARFLFNINFVLVCTLVSNTVGFLVAILMARALGPDGRGVTALYQAAVGLGYAFLNLGIGSAAFYFVTRREITGRQAVEAGLTVSALAASIAIVGVLLTTLLFESHLAGKDIPYGLAIVTVPAAIQLRIVEALLRAEGRFGAMNLLALLLPLSMLCFIGGAEVIWGLTVPLAIWAWSLAHLPALVLGYGMLGRRYLPRTWAPLSLLIKAARFGSQSAVTNLIELAKYRLDIFLVLVLVNTAGVGIYTVSLSQTEGLWVVADSIAIVLLTNITAGDAANAARLTPVVCRNTLLVTAIAALVAALIAGFWIPVVFGRDYQDSVLPYLWLLPGTVALSGSKILAGYVFSRGRPIINAWISLATLIASVPIVSLLLLLFGVAGAAVGTSIGYTLDLALTAIAYRWLSGRPIHEALIPRRSDAWIYIDGVRSVLRRLRRHEPVEASTLDEGAPHQA